MSKLGITRIISVLALVFTVMSSLIIAPAAVVAADDETTQPTLTLECDIPKYSDDSGKAFTYSCSMEYDGTDNRTVNFDLSAPQGWTAYISYSSKQVTSIEIGPGSSYGPDSKTFTVYFAPNTGTYPDPGDYELNITATSGQYTISKTLTASVKAKYTFTLSTDTGNLATTATAGKENHFSFNAVNGSTVEVNDIIFNVTKPSDWVVTFSPEKISSLGSGQTQQVDVIITPPKNKTVAGDYEITIKASNAKVSDDMDVRVTVQTPTIWGWVGLIIIAIVIAGLIFLFAKMGRR